MCHLAMGGDAGKCLGVHRANTAKSEISRNLIIHFMRKLD